MSNDFAPLGKGLSALLTSTDPQTIVEEQRKGGYIPEVPIDDIVKNPYQPRVNPEEKLEGLVDSIRKNGFISAILVTQLGDGKYQLVTGERRLMAAKRAGLTKVPVIVKDVAGGALLEIAILENIQRKDLNPIEEGNAYNQLQDEFGMTLKEIAKKIGVSESIVAHRIALLHLPAFVHEAILREDINMVQAEQLFPLVSDPDSMKIALSLCIKNQLSAKQLRSIVDKLAAGLSMQRARKIKDEKTREMEISLTKLIGKKIYFNRTHKGGKIIISFNNDDELDQIYKRLSYIGYHI